LISRVGTTMDTTMTMGRRSMTVMTMRKTSV
jgi:hypothetical protein